MQRAHFALIMATLTVTGLSGQQTESHPVHPTIQLWPHDPPGATALGAPEADTTTPTDNMVAGRRIIRLGHVYRPTLAVYAAAHPNGSAIVVFPGGSYQILAFDLEGTEVCDWLNSTGVTCILVKYRVPDSGPYPKSAAALQDAQRALGLVRLHAAEWHIDPQRIGVLGFSAGAHLSATLSTHFDQRLYERQDDADDKSCRPDFTVLVYPAYLALSEENFALSHEIHVTERTPPTFIVQTEDDPLPVESSLVYFQALKSAKVPAEMHLYAEGGHGYGLRQTERPVTRWPKLVEEWLRTIHISDNSH